MSEILNPSRGLNNSWPTGFPRSREARVVSSNTVNPSRSGGASTPSYQGRTKNSAPQSLKDILSSDEDSRSVQQKTSPASEQRKDYDPTRLSEEEKKELEELKARDLEVRRHEAAHMAAAGSLASGGIHFTYKKGADGKNYAVSGEVSIDTSPGITPEETIRKASQIRSAALAASDPSSADMKVATSAYLMELEAKKELQNERSRMGLDGENTSEALNDIFSSRKAGVAALPDSRESHASSAEHVKFCQSCLEKAFKSLQPDAKPKTGQLAKFA